MGSKSDRKIAEKVEKVLEEFEVSYETRVASAHRTPQHLTDIVRESRAHVFIAIAGLAAHLPGVIAAHTLRPVIAVPVDVKLDGLDALLSSVQMPPGVPVATVGVGQGKNAALLALEILAVKDKSLENKLIRYRKKMATKVIEDDKEVSGIDKDRELFSEEKE
ncbi:MAG TPA: 5-(carboxyamino)imidazole ribonucleotide mutase [Thermoplasmata archaeon]|nr:5-(carboxyamino)imidazole ribonucleotide mutase [Thermoplasmata archaeon]